MQTENITMQSGSDLTLIKQSLLGPAYLHSNSTSHPWAFGAFAELIDNAYDPDVMAKEIHIDMCVIDGKICITFKDDGKGMDDDHLHKMLSFGFCEKGQYEGKFGRRPLGQYGTGFKSGSMRLAQDALVFTYTAPRNKQSESASVGFLSQTFLLKTKSPTIRVPIITYDTQPRQTSPTSDSNLEQILRYSVYKYEDELIDVLEDLARWNNGKIGGTKIVLFNISRLREESGEIELDFITDPTDIRLKTYVTEDPTYTYSLKAYCSILYQAPNLKMKIRGEKVNLVKIVDTLYNVKLFTYRPEKKKGNSITIHFGMSPDKERDYGMVLYHKKRLITAYEKCSCQTNKKNPIGAGVVGVAEAMHLVPTQNKQAFDDRVDHKNFMQVLSTKLKEYWAKTDAGDISQMKRKRSRCLSGNTSKRRHRQVRSDEEGDTAQDESKSDVEVTSPPLSIEQTTSDCLDPLTIAKQVKSDEEGETVVPMAQDKNNSDVQDTSPPLNIEQTTSDCLDPLTIATGSHIVAVDKRQTEHVEQRDSLVSLARDGISIYESNRFHDKAAQTEDAFGSLEARFEGFKRNVSKLLRIIQPAIEAEDLDDIELMVCLMIQEEENAK